MSKAPSMPMYWDAYLADTTHLTAEEHGAYLLLLGAMWRRNGSVPDDDRDNARILGLTIGKWRKVKARLSDFLIFENDEISQKKLQKIWKKTQEKIEKNRQNGAKGGRPKSNENKDLTKANGSVSVNPNESIPEPEPEPEPQDIKERAQARTKKPDPFIEKIAGLCSPEAAKSYRSYRSRHRLSVSQQVATRTANVLLEIKSEGGDPDDALALAEERNWKGLKADWYFNEKGNQNGRNYQNGRTTQNQGRVPSSATPEEIADRTTRLTDQIEAERRSGGHSGSRLL